MLCRWHPLGRLHVGCVPGVSSGPWNLETLALPEPGRVMRSGTWGLSLSSPPPQLRLLRKGGGPPPACLAFLAAAAARASRAASCTSLEQASRGYLSLRPRALFLICSRGLLHRQHFPEAQQHTKGSRLMDCSLPL